MLLRKWEDLPQSLKNERVRIYYDSLSKKRVSLILKKTFDKAFGTLTLIIVSPLLLIIAIAIKLDSQGPIFYRQERITQYGRPFMIFKFRTMVVNADKMGAHVTSQNDSRVTKIGKYLRKYRLDEIPQLINIITGDMSFVGTRPEAVRYVAHYSDEMMATLLLPAGVTSTASIKYKDEERLLADAENAETTYIDIILPEKMKYNLSELLSFSFWIDMLTMMRTLIELPKHNIFS